MVQRRIPEHPDFNARLMIAYGNHERCCINNNPEAFEMLAYKDFYKTHFIDLDICQRRFKRTHPIHGEIYTRCINV